MRAHFPEQQLGSWPRLSHSAANGAGDDERQWVRFSMVMRRDRLYRVSAWLS